MFIFEDVCDWLKRRNEAKTEEVKKNGFSWASGELLSGKPLCDVEALIVDKNQYGYTAFDEGAADAVNAFSKVTGLNDIKLNISYTVHGYYMVSDQVEARVVRRLVKANNFESIKHRMVITGFSESVEQDDKDAY